MATRSAKLREFRQTLPPEESELDICPPGCCVDHDAKWPNRPKRPTGKSEPSIPSKLIGIEVPGVPTVTSSGLLRHATLFGSDGVVEVAALYGVKVPDKIKSIPSKSLKKPKVKRVPLLEQARDMVAMGLPWIAIEDTLDLPKSVSDRYKKELLA